MRCVGCGSFGMGGGRCRACGAIVPLPDEELVRGLSPSLDLEPVETHALELPSGPAPGAGVELSRVIEPLSSAVRRVTARAVRPKDPIAEWRREAALAEEEGAPREALEFLGRCLLEAPLDPSPIRDLERLAASHDLRTHLAAIYEQLLTEKTDHPSAPALRRRVEQLLAAAAAAGEVSHTWDDAAESSRSPSVALPREPGAPLPGPAEVSAESPRGPSFVLAHEPGAPLSGPAEVSAESSRGPSFALAGEPGAPLSGPTERSAESSRGPSFVLAHEPGAPLSGPTEVSAESSLTRAGAALAVGTRALLSFGRRTHGRAPLPGAEREERATWAFRRLPGDPVQAPVHARLAAFAIDAAVLVSLPLLILGIGIRGSLPQGLGLFDQILHLAARHGSVPVAAIGLGLSLAFVYLTLSWALGGRTLGESVAGIRAVEEGGAHLRLGRAALRSAVAILGTAAFLASPLWALFDPQRQTLHDRIAGTRTVRA